MRWILALDAVCVGLVVLLLLRRLTIGWPHRAPARVFAGAVTAIAPIIVGAWLVLGPLQPGWARVAGTPPSLLATSSALAGRPQTSASASQGSAQYLRPFEGTLAGSIQQRSDQQDELAVVEIQTVLSGGASGRLQIVLRGEPLSGGGISLVSSRVTLAIGSAPTYRGPVVALEGDSLVASLASDGHPDLQLSIRLQFDQVPGPVTGVAAGRFASGAGEGN